MSFRVFLKKVEDLGETVHVWDRVSPNFEISAVMKFIPQFPVIFFENVDGYNVRVAGNICATRRRICLALETTPDKLYDVILEAMRQPEQPKIVDDSPVKEVIEEPRLSKIPILKHFEGDAGPYITSAIISARSPDGTIENVSVHRLLMLDDKRLAIRLVPRHLFRLWSMAKESKHDLDVAIAIGVHPAVLLAASCSPPFGVSEYDVANKML
ncbi:UbiD family decarboxylase, partial [Candidatus Bathyarchaeota archaeon]|nr:UbiD family decarboxylase [Candidatus Bathyarchaeota archaeon]